MAAEVRVVAFLAHLELVEVEALLRPGQQLVHPREPLRAGQVSPRQRLIYDFVLFCLVLFYLVFLFLFVTVKNMYGICTQLLPLAVISVASMCVAVNGNKCTPATEQTSIGDSLLQLT
jgi:hypothetical protein